MPILLTDGMPITEAESNHPTAFKASIQTVKHPICAHSIGQSDVAMCDNEEGTSARASYREASQATWQEDGV